MNIFMVLMKKNGEKKLKDVIKEKFNNFNLFNRLHLGQLNRFKV